MFDRLMDNTILAHKWEDHDILTQVLLPFSIMFVQQKYNMYGITKWLLSKHENVITIYPTKIS